MLFIQYIRSVIFWFGFTTVTIVVMTCLTFMAPLPFRWRFYISRGWSYGSIYWLRFTCGLRHEVSGLENIPGPDDKPVLYMCKHQSTWETMLFQKMMPPMVWVMKRELMWIPIFGWGVAMLHPIAINRKDGKKALAFMMDEGRKRIDEGISIMIFPEGTRRPIDAEPRYHVGGALMAAKLKIPVVPIAHNAGHFWPRNTLLKYPGTIKMVIGEPIETEGKSASQILAESQEWIETTTNNLGGR